MAYAFRFGSLQVSTQHVEVILIIMNEGEIWRLEISFTDMMKI